MFLKVPVSCLVAKFDVRVLVLHRLLVYYLRRDYKEPNFNKLTYRVLLCSFVSQGKICDSLRGADGKQVTVRLAVPHDEGLLMQLVDVHPRRISGIPVLQVAVNLSERRGGREHQQEERRDHFDAVF